MPGIGAPLVISATIEAKGMGYGGSGEVEAEVATASSMSEDSGGDNGGSWPGRGSGGDIDGWVSVSAESEGDVGDFAVDPRGTDVRCAL